MGRIFEVFVADSKLEEQGADRIVRGDIKEGWLPVQSLVNGSVLGATLREITGRPNRRDRFIYARTRFESVRNPKATFTVAGAAQASLWVDGRAVSGNTSFTTDLTAGIHTVTIRLDARHLPRIVRLISRDVVFATE